MSLVKFHSLAANPQSVSLQQVLVKPITWASREHFVGMNTANFSAFSGIDSGQKASIKSQPAKCITQHYLPLAANCPKSATSAVGIAEHHHFTLMNHKRDKMSPFAIESSETLV